MTHDAVVRAPAVLLRRTDDVQVRRHEHALLPFLAPIGLAFLLVGGADLALTWYPLHVGSPEWELGTIMQTLNGMPVLSLGLFFLWSWALGRRGRWPLLSISAAMILLAIAVAAMTVLLALSLPVALHAIQAPGIRMGLEKATIKAGLQIVAFTTLFLWLGATGLRRASSSQAWREGV